MNGKIKLLLEKIKKPKPLFAGLFVTVSVIIIAVTLVSLAFPDFPEIVAYALYAVSAICLTYTVYITVLVVPKIKAWTVRILRKTEFTSNVLDDYGFRTTVFAVVTFIISVGYALMEGVIAITTASLWFGALAFYYFILALIRGFLLNAKRRAKKHIGKEHEYPIIITKIFRATGISLIILTLAFSVEVFHVGINGQTFKYAGLTIFASAAYAFYKIIHSTVNFAKARKFEDLTIGAIRNVNLADALVSILALQTALLNAYSTGDTGIYNLLTGSVFCALIIFVGVIMIIKANKLLTRYKNERR